MPSVPPNRREVLGWVMYDWANSAYSTLSITVLVIYIKSIVVAPDSSVALDLTRWASLLGKDTNAENWGAVVWAWGISLSMLIAAVLSPVLGAMADAHGNKRTWLAATALAGSCGACLFFFIPPENGWTVVFLFFGVTLMFELSIGFYNAFLPEIATENEIDRISAWGYAVGYVGGGLALALALGLFKFGESLGLSDPVRQIRVALLLMGGWWGLFSLPTIFWLQDRWQPKSEPQLGSAILRAVREVAGTLGNIRQYRVLALFLLGFLFYNDGIQTVISQSSVFAEEELGFRAEDLALLILAIQFISLFGAITVGYVSRRFGQKPTLMICLGVWVILLCGAYFVETKAQFWVLAVVLGLVMGGTQSVSRAIMGVMTPAHRSAEFFGFFNFSGKATSWLGTFLFGLITLQTGSPRMAIVSLLVLFAIGWAITAAVNVAEGKRQAAS